MSKVNWRASALPVAGCLLLAACSRTEDGAGTPADPGAQAPAAATVWETMTQAIVPASNKIWELAGNLYNDDGNIDASQLASEQWQQLKEAAQTMQASATTLAGAQPVVVAPAGVKILNEGTAGALGAAEVQAAIDANPQVFQEDAAGLVAIAKDLVAAADAKDAVQTDALSNQLTEVCGACHMRFWTPNQPQ